MTKHTVIDEKIQHGASDNVVFEEEHPEINHEEIENEEHIVEEDKHED